MPLRACRPRNRLLTSPPMLELNTEVKFVRGVGPRIAETLAAKGISTVEDLLYYLPFRYEDRLNPRHIAELQPGEMAALIAEVRSFGLFRTRRMPIFQLTVGEPGGALPEAAASGVEGAQPPIFEPKFRAGLMRRRPSLKCLWFNGGYLRDRFQHGQIVALYGK